MVVGTKDHPFERIYLIDVNILSFNKFFLPVIGQVNAQSKPITQFFCCHEIPAAKGNNRPKRYIFY
jgi:hypothetical protein